MSKIVILIPAAGASRRMGAKDKLLELVGDDLLLQHVVKVALAVTDRVLVTLPSKTSARAEAIRGLPVTGIEVPDAADGMSASLRRAAKAVSTGVDGLMIFPADMPDLTADDLHLITSEFEAADQSAIVQGTGSDGIPGHPVIFPADLISAFGELEGDIGAKPILRANKHRLRRVALPGDNALTDLDTPEAWAKWRLANPTL